MFCYVIVFLPSHGAECTTICIKDAQQLGWPLPSSSSLWALVAFQLITSIHLVQCFWPGQQRNAHNVHLMPDSWKNSWLPSRPRPADSGKFTRDTTVQVFKGVCWRDEWLVEAIGNDWKWFTERVGRMLQSRILLVPLFRGEDTVSIAVRLMLFILPFLYTFFVGWFFYRPFGPFALTLNFVQVGKRTVHYLCLLKWD